MAHEGLKEKIEELEAELSNTKVNKRTEFSVGTLKGKIAKLKEELEGKISKGGGKGEGFAVKKEGDATVGLLGKPSVGKSTLLSKITNKESKIAAYEFTTLDCIPGLLFHKHTNLQILDLPGIIERAADNRGFGKKVLSVVRACDLIIFVVDSRFTVSEMKMLLNETYKAGIRFNGHKPFIEIKRLSSGGVQVPLNNSSENISYELIHQIVTDKKYTNVEVIIHEKNLGAEDFVDACYGNLEYRKAVICINKIDLFSTSEIKEKAKELKELYLGFPVFGVSAEEEINLDKFKDFLWSQLGFIWIYLKEQRKDPDMTNPLVIRKGDNVEKVCLRIHHDILKKFKYAKIYGKSAKFEWQRVGLEHVVEDGDIIEIYAR